MSVNHMLEDIRNEGVWEIQFPK